MRLVIFESWDKLDWKHVADEFVPSAVKTPENMATMEKGGTVEHGGKWYAVQRFPN